MSLVCLFTSTSQRLIWSTHSAYVWANITRNVKTCINNKVRRSVRVGKKPQYELKSIQNKLIRMKADGKLVKLVTDKRRVPNGADGELV